jgi:conjugative relaxase-like TrwC/TraI family protein
MTLHVLGAGTGYRYLTDQVAGGDGQRQAGQSLTEYYQQTGNPPGRWMGTGAQVLGVEGQVATRQMHNLYGLGLHPESGVQLGRRFQVFRSVAERVRDRLDAAQAGGRLLSEMTVAVIEKEELAKGERQAVSGFDHVFSPVKSVSLAWGLATDPRVVAEIEAAHHEAVAHTIRWLERDVVFARTGTAGVAQVDVHGVAVAAFDHRTSRAGDPDLHTHAVISNKVLARLPDGETRWLTLDSQALHKAAVAASERYNRTLEEEISRRLGWEFEVRADQDPAEPTAIREIAGVQLGVIRGFSSRRNQIEVGHAQLVADYHRIHGHMPPKAVQYELAQQATLAHRPPKALLETVTEERDRWADEAASLLGPEGLAELQERLQPADPLAVHTGRDVPDHQVEELAAAALTDVTDRRSTWTVRHVQAAAQRASRTLLMASPEARDTLVSRIVATVLSGQAEGQQIVRLNPPEAIAAPPELQRAAGESVFFSHASERYTTANQMQAEDALLTHARRQDDVQVSDTDLEVAQWAAQQRGMPLTGDQLAAVTSLTRSRRGLQLLIGPAGTGKTTTVRGLVEAWQADGVRRVHGLAPTAVAAAVLKAETGMVETETLHRWAAQVQETGELPFQPGDLVVIDEAGMVGTSRLLDVVDAAESAGAKVVLVGDHRQLGAIESGGALRLLATDEPGAVAELTTVWRFADVAPDGTRTIRQWEADASLLLRTGDAAALDTYIDHGRVNSGAEAVLLDDLYAAWKADQDAGMTAVMIASRTDVVARLGTRARADRVAAGIVQADGVRLSDGTDAGVGDVIVTRKNNRLLRAGGEFVKNGDLWTVEAVDGDGGLRVRHTQHDGQVTLPAEYVAERVEQGYAMTVHRAQGSTVDAGHVLVDESYSRELLYVAMTRGRFGNTAHVVTDHVLDPDLERPAPGDQLARAVLSDVLRRESGDRSATETLREAYAEAGSLRTLLPRYRYASAVHADSPARDVVAAGLAPDTAAKVIGAPAWEALAERIGMLEERGVDVARQLGSTVTHRDLEDAVDPAAVLHYRLQGAVEASRPAGGDWLPPAPSVGNESLPIYLRELREAMDTRASNLGAIAAAERPDWTMSLPPVPAEPTARAGWEQVAGRVAAYREAYDVTGPDPLGELPREPRQHEAHDQLQDAIRQLPRDSGEQELATQLEAAQQRLRVAENDYWAAQREPGPAATGAADRQVEAAEKTLARLAEAEEAEQRWEQLAQKQAESAGELARARTEAETARRREKAVKQGVVDELQAQRARDAAVLQRAAEVAVKAAIGLPPAGAREAARADAVRTLARARELIAEGLEERARRTAEVAARRVATDVALRQARQQVADLQARSGVQPPAEVVRPVELDDQRPAETGRDLER